MRTSSSTRRLILTISESGNGRFCCKSRKLNDPRNLAKVDFCTSLLLHRLSTPGRRPVIGFGWIGTVPHIAARQTHQRLWEFSFTTPKRLLQQYLPQADIGSAPPNVC